MGEFREIPLPVENPLDIVVEDDPDATNNDDSAFEISKVSKDTFIIVGGKINRLASVTDERNPEQVIRFQNILTGMGVFEKLNSMGVKDGDTIIVGKLEFAYYADEFYG
jgi:GTP-binding protein